jgi:hypothetical protein
MNDRFSEQRINIKFCMKLGKNASDTCATLSKAYGEKLWKSQVFLSGINDSKRACISESQIKTMLILFFNTKVLFTFSPFHKAKVSTKLIVWKYWRCYVKLCVEKTWTLVQYLDSLPRQRSRSQDPLCQAVSGPKIDYWNRKPTLFIWFGSKWLLAVSKNKFCLKRMKISGYWKHPTKRDDGPERCSTTGVPKMFPTVAASLGWVHRSQRQYFKGDPFQ